MSSSSGLQKSPELLRKGAGASGPMQKYLPPTIEVFKFNILTNGLDIQNNS